MKQLKLHFKTYAEVKVFEMGIDGAVQFFLERYRYYNSNKKYQKSWYHVSFYSMCLEYLINEYERN